MASPGGQGEGDENYEDIYENSCFASRFHCVQRCTNTLLSTGPKEGMDRVVTSFPWQGMLTHCKAKCQQ
jgi:hypothetical protein